MAAIRSNQHVTGSGRGAVEDEAGGRLGAAETGLVAGFHNSEVLPALVQLPPPCVSCQRLVTIIITTDIFKAPTSRLKALNISLSASNVTWCFTPSQPVWLCQGERLVKPDLKKKKLWGKYI